MTSRIRIIGGQWKRRLLPVPDAPGLRPTPDRVRETLFNWLGQDLTGWRCIDLFAGSGALGFEAASRGAARVDMVEQNPAIARGLQGSIQQLGGFISAEADFPLTPEWLARQQCGRLVILRSGRAGQVHYHLLQDTGDGGVSVRAAHDPVADAGTGEGIHSGFPGRGWTAP